MSIKINQLVQDINPSNTVLLLGAGASIPSGAPSVAKIMASLSTKFGIQGDYSLSELASLIENKFSRRSLIEELRKMFQNLHPSGGIRNIGRYQWKSIYSTNYDDLLEQSASIHKRKFRTYSSNFDFKIIDTIYDLEIFKIHGTIDKDISDGHASRIIISESDYENTEDYREYIFDRFKGDLAGSNLIILGQSLADADMKDIVTRAANLNSKTLSPAQISLLIYTPDENRASLYEKKGIKVAFGGIDDFFAEMASRTFDKQPDSPAASDPIDGMPGVVAVTTEVSEAVIPNASNISSMFNGWPATIADILAGYTFDRTATQQIIDYFGEASSLCAYILGAAGVGKSTVARQALLKARIAGQRAWEHNGDHTLRFKDWITIARSLREQGEIGVLFVDEAHSHILEINDLIDGLASDDNAHLKIILCSTRNHWGPRIKTPNLFKYGREIRMSKLDNHEIDSLLRLVSQNAEVAKLVENSFSGFSKTEKHRRLVDRCEADMFVCLKNIFASDTFDDIILREYASIDPALQDIYRHVAAMENAGVRVHRQLVIRILGLNAQSTSAILENINEIIHEYTIDGRYGIYAWRCRHNVISAIVTKYKFHNIGDVIKLFDLVIENISPAYEIEIRTLRELCNIETGIGRIPDKNVQNRLLRKMISIAPAERVPRHRLIRNLIDQNEFDKAETEIRIFGHDFGGDGPVQRYKVKLLVARAVNSPGIMPEDRIAILNDAYGQATIGVTKYPNNKSIMAGFAELGVEYYRRTGSLEYYEQAISELKSAEERIGDPEFSSIIRQYERRIAGQPFELDGEGS